MYRQKSNRSVGTGNTQKALPNEDEPPTSGSASRRGFSKLLRPKKTDSASGDATLAMNTSSQSFGSVGSETGLSKQPSRRRLRSKSRDRTAGTSASTPDGGNTTEDNSPKGVKRFLKGKKVIRVKRGESNESLSHMIDTSGSAGGKVLRVKVKRKPNAADSAGGPTTTSSATADVDSMAPAGALNASSSRRRGGQPKSDKSVGALSRARSWFTFGGMKVRGKDSFGLDHEDDDEDDDELDEEEVTQFADQDDNPEQEEEEADIPGDNDTTEKPALPAPPQSPVREKDQEPVEEKTQQPSATTTSTRLVSPKAQKPTLGPSKAPATPKSQRSGGSKTKQARSSKHQPPSKEIVVNAIPPRRQALTGVALRRLKIQERWLSKGCNYHPNEYLMKAFRSSKEDDPPEEVSEISYDDPVYLVMGPDAPDNVEVEFWTHTCDSYEHGRFWGLQNGRTAEAYLNKGIAQLNTRHVAEAIESFLEAVAMIQELHGEDSLVTARGLHLLGSAFFLDSQLSTAAEATLKALEIRKTGLGPFHTDTVDTFSNLAMIYLKMNQLVEAARIFSEVLKIRVAIYHDLHPSVAFPARSLGCVYAKRRDTDRATRSYAHALRCFDHYNMEQERRDTVAEMRRFGLPAP